MSSVAVAKALMRYVEAGAAPGRQCPDCASHAQLPDGRRCSTGGFWVRRMSGCASFQTAVSPGAAVAGRGLGTESPNQACGPSAA